MVVCWGKGSPVWTLFILRTIHYSRYFHLPLGLLTLLGPHHRSHLATHHSLLGFSPGTNGINRAEITHTHAHTHRPHLMGHHTLGQRRGDKSSAGFSRHDIAELAGCQQREGGSERSYELHRLHTLNMDNTEGINTRYSRAADTRATRLGEG